MSTKVATAGVPTSPQEAFRIVVHEFGVKKLAEILLMKPGTLYNKADADAGSHHQPTLRDIVDVTRATGDCRVLDSLDRLFNRAAYDLTPGMYVSDEALLELLCRVNSDNGAMHRTLKSGLEDGRFTREELSAVRSEAFELITSVLTFLHRLEGMVDD
jgi:hypothetical protein